MPGPSMRLSVAASTLRAMNTDDLSWQVGNYGGLGPRKVALLLEHDRLDLLIGAARERGEWFCAEEAARELCRSGEFRRALEVMEPFAATGWPAAVWAKAEVLLRAGRVEEALALVDPGGEGGAAPVVRGGVVELLARAGHVDEAIDLLVPHLGAAWRRTALVEITEGGDRDELVLELLAPHVAAERQAHDTGRGGSCRSDARELKARVLERAGRAQEALRVYAEDIAGCHPLSDDTVVAYAGLLARHGRLDDLRVLVAEQDAHTFLDIYAGALRGHGRAQEAEIVMREAIAADDWVGYRAWLSSALLHDGRLDDAIAVAEPGFSGHDCSNLLVPLVHCLLERPAELLHLLDHPLTVPHHGHEEFQHWWRAFALAQLGRVEEAMAVVEAHPDPFADPRIVRAGLLGAAGRLAEAAAQLREVGTLEARQELFDVLVRQGRAAEAISIHPTVPEQRAARAMTEPVPRREGYSAEPPA